VSVFDYDAYECGYCGPEHAIRLAADMAGCKTLEAVCEEVEERAARVVESEALGLGKGLDMAGEGGARGGWKWRCREAAVARWWLRRDMKET
jgi:hypothetical protein